MRALFLLAYTCSGVAGLIYQVCWTRLLTLYIGHTTAAASAVVGAFLGGLAIGSAIRRTRSIAWLDTDSALAREGLRRAMGGY